MSDIGPLTGIQRAGASGTSQTALTPDIRAVRTENTHCAFMSRSPYFLSPSGTEGLGLRLRRNTTPPLDFQIFTLLKSRLARSSFVRIAGGLRIFFSGVYRGIGNSHQARDWRDGRCVYRKPESCGVRMPPRIGRDEMIPIR